MGKSLPRECIGCKAPVKSDFTRHRNSCKAVWKGWRYKNSKGEFVSEDCKCLCIVLVCYVLRLPVVYILVELPKRATRVTSGEPGLPVCEVEPKVNTEKECLRKVANNQVDNYSKSIKEAALKYLMRECLRDKRFTVPALKALAEEAYEEFDEELD